MQEILEFLLKRRYSLIFIVLEIITLTLVVKYNKGQKDIFWYNVDLASNIVKEKRSQYVDYFSLRAQNDSILAENASLNAKIKAYDYFQNDRFPNDSLEFLKQYEYIAARVIDNSIDKSRNYLILNLGENSGINIGDGVVNKDGIVGIVMSTTKKYSKVISTLHRDFRLSAGLESKNYFGYLYWEPYDYEHLWMTGVPKHVELKKGDKIVAHFSIIFPNDYPIGSIVDYSIDPGSNYYTIKVKLSASMTDINGVYVIRNKDQVQLDSLLTNIHE